MDLRCDMDQMLVHLLLLDVVQILDALVHRHRPDVVRRDVLQNLDVVRPVVEHLDALHPLVAVVDAELRRRLRKDYFQDVVDVAPLLEKRMGCYQDEAQLVHPVSIDLELVELLLVHLESRCKPQLQLMPPALPRVMPSALPNQHRALLQVLLRVLDLPQA